jgi:hypothetical protein
MSTPALDPVKKHQHDVRMHIVAPVVLSFAATVLVAIGLLIAVAAGSMVNEQITVIAGILATVFVLIPLVIVCLIPYVLLVLGAYGAGRAYANAQTPLRFVRRLTGQITDKTDQLAPKVAKPMIALSTRLTRWEYTLRGWQDPALPTGKELSDHE